MRFGIAYAEHRPFEDEGESFLFIDLRACGAVIQSKFRGILIEGIPHQRDAASVAARQLAHAKLDRLERLEDRLGASADAERWSGRLLNFRVEVREQIAFADVLLLNKTDLVPAQQVDRLEQRISARHFLPGKVSITAAHLLGGCGMGDGPADSVTDSWGRVHGLPWLRVADSALFPDSLEINPYVTIMALADRVAEGIRTDFSRGD